MNRRSFVGGLAVAAGAGLAWPQPALAQAVQRPEAGIQVFSFGINNAPWEQFSAALGRIREMGYDGIQLAGLQNRDPAAIRRRCEELGLALRSMHIGNDQVAAYTPPPLPQGQTLPAGERPPFQYAATAAYTPTGIVQVARAMLPRARDAGVQRAMIGHSGWENLSSLDNIKRWCEAMNQANQIAQRTGLQLSYHSHDLDFRPVSGQTPFDLMVAGTDPSLRYELDVGWCAFGGADPVAVINRHYARLASLHLRDLRDQQLVVIGAGNVIKWPELMQAARRIQDCTYYAEHNPGPQPEATASSALRFMREQLGLGRRAA
jgi:sugar phosphate isomerase/epimerase